LNSNAPTGASESLSFARYFLDPVEAHLRTYPCVAQHPSAADIVRLGQI
jgi:hypothetical protein